MEHTYEECQEFGYQVKKGEIHAFGKWVDDEYNTYFSEDQVEPIKGHLTEKGTLGINNTKTGQFDSSMELSGVSGGFNLTPSYDEGCLECPVCGDTWMHQGTVEVWNRLEDAKDGSHVVVGFAGVYQDNNMSNNPSSRRQGMSVTYECECCGRISNLITKQHKGQTIVEWALGRGSFAEHIRMENKNGN